MTIAVDDPLDRLAGVVLGMEPDDRRRFIETREPDELDLVERALAARSDPLGKAVYRKLGYEPICIPRVVAALDAGYLGPIDAEEHGMVLPPMCGRCPAERFDDALEFDVLFGGAAGGSKTKSALMVAIRCLARWDGFRALFLRETFDQLDENVYPELRAIDYAAEIGGHWNAGRRQLDVGNSSMRFRYMADLDDALQRRGGSYQLIVLDERNLLAPGVADMLRDRLRSADRTVPVIGLRSTANPGGKSHGELKGAYVKPDPRLVPTSVTEHGDVVTTVRRGRAEFERRYIPAKSTDNPYLGPDYDEQVLGAIEDEVLRAAMKDGNWDTFVGQYFGEWADARHVVPRDALQLADSWGRFEGIDYGRAAPFCMLRAAVDGDGRAWVYREIYRAGLDETVQAKMIVEDEERCGDRDAKRAGDASMWNKNSEAPSIADRYAENGVRMTPSDSGPGSRVIGWARVHSFLADGEPCPYHAALGWESCPMLHVLEGTAPNLVRTLPDLPFDKHKVEDLDSDAEDHAADALRYLLMQVKAPRTRRRLAGEAQRAATASA